LKIMDAKEETGEALHQAAALMASFAERTGLTSDRPKQRYLWTDAFAVCNFLGLARRTGEARYLDLALKLVDQVHQVLGRYRSDDTRTGWLSGLGEQEGAAHPTVGGLRIGKRFPERRPEEPFDERREWDQDGQYFHYLTKWMYALDLLARATREPRFNLWARELAETAHRSFTYQPRGAQKRRMVWKMSTDLSRPLISSMGQHDPLDGFITCMQLGATAALLPSAPAGPELKPASADFSVLLEGLEVYTDDPLGIGGLLCDACRVAQLAAQGTLADGALLERLLDAAAEGLILYVRQGEWRRPAPLRLAFREFGLTIGLSGVELIQQSVRGQPSGIGRRVKVRDHLAELPEYAGLGPVLRSFWLVPEHQRIRSWAEHLDINEVMLATSLLPEGFLVLPPAA
jgi:hypothetical protein